MNDIFPDRDIVGSTESPRSFVRSCLQNDGSLVSVVCMACTGSQTLSNSLGLPVVCVRATVDITAELRRLAERGDPRQPVGSHRRSKGGSKRYNAGKKISGRKRHILTDTDGRLLAVHVHGADIQDRDGGKGVLKRSRARFPFVQRAYADGGYAGRLVEWAKDKTHIVLEIIRRNTAAKGFEVLPRRWGRANLRLDHEKPPLRSRLRATHQCCRNPHRHRGMHNTR